MSKTKLLTNREMELLRVGLSYLFNVNRMQIGAMETSKEEIAKDFVSYLSFKIDEDDLAEVCEEVGGS